MDIASYKEKLIQTINLSENNIFFDAVAECVLKCSEDGVDYAEIIDHYVFTPKELLDIGYDIDKGKRL